jgi:hypothetical protein
VDVYESYYSAPAADTLDLSSEPPSAKGLAVFRDPSSIKRTATSVNWHPEGTKIAGERAHTPPSSEAGGWGGTPASQPARLP